MGEVTQSQSIRINSAEIDGSPTDRLKLISHARAVWFKLLVIFSYSYSYSYFYFSVTLSSYSLTDRDRSLNMSDTSINIQQSDRICC